MQFGAKQDCEEGRRDGGHGLWKEGSMGLYASGELFANTQCQKRLGIMISATS
jgi:hypothetical protein